jgi:hypothetical protein
MEKNWDKYGEYVRQSDLDAESLYKVLKVWANCRYDDRETVSAIVRKLRAVADLFDPLGVVHSLVILDVEREWVEEILQSLPPPLSVHK